MSLHSSVGRASDLGSDLPNFYSLKLVKVQFGQNSYARDHIHVLYPVIMIKSGVRINVIKDFGRTKPCRFESPLGQRASVGSAATAYYSMG